MNAQAGVLDVLAGDIYIYADVLDVLAGDVNIWVFL